VDIPDRQAWQRRGRSFGPAAERYDRMRPSYPLAALRWILGEAPKRVVDLGAGTGILTRQLVALGHHVLPVEPDPEMRARIAADLAPLDGTAEAIPLPDASVDAVVAGQSHHWFDPARAHPEIARVLRPGGVFGPLWNERDERVPWVARLSRLADDIAERGGPLHIIESFGPHFEPLERRFFRHATTHTVDSLVELMRTRSYYLTATAERQAEVEAAIRDLVATHPDLTGRTTFELPIVTDTYRAVRREPPLARHAGS
jgi:SAM-dependent methyltransferase